MPETAFLITAFATLFVVIDPPGLVPLFIALTRGMGDEKRRAMARRACVIAAALLLLFGLAGEAILTFIGISMPAFRIAGGILLFLTALDMLFERRTQRREGQQAEPDHDPSVFPDCRAGRDCLGDPAGRPVGAGLGRDHRGAGADAGDDGRDLGLPPRLAAA